MERSRWLMVGISVTAAVASILCLNWFVGQLYPDRYPGELAYKPVENMPPRVDLASIQRGWPDSLDEPGERNRLTAYRHDFERQAPAPAALPSAVPATVLPLDLDALLASADANTGKSKARVCASCHDFAPGGPDRVGPNLWGVIGRDIAARAGFSYSPAMAAQPGAWTYDRLFAYLESPSRAIPGNKMSFAGLRHPADRAAVIKYLNSLDNNPRAMTQPRATGSGTPPAR
ncbi:MAG: cytochrome c family protein [Sphingorhabdus sp.]